MGLIEQRNLSIIQVMQLSSILLDLRVEESPETSLYEGVMYQKITATFWIGKGFSVQIGPMCRLNVNSKMFWVLKLKM